jgi:hypothetical protein
VEFFFSFCVSKRNEILLGIIVKQKVNKKNSSLEKSGVVDPDQFDLDTDLIFHFDATPDPDSTPTV